MNRKYAFDSEPKKDFNKINKDLVLSLLDYVYERIDISKYKYKVLKYEDDLQCLMQDKYYVSANVNGKNCLLVFKKINNKYISFLIDKKNLKYNREHINIEEIKYYFVQNRNDYDIYDGTIIDGIFVENRRSNDKLFLMTDVYEFKGSLMINDNLKNKLLQINAYLNSKKNDKFLNNMTFVVNNIYPLCDILKLKEIILKSSGLDTRGFTFYPEISGTKLYFLNIDSENKKNKEIIKVENKEDDDFDKKILSGSLQDVIPKKLKYINITGRDVYAILEMRKPEGDTPIPDIYYVYCINEDGTKMLKIGIFSINTIETSIMCKKIMKEKKNGRALMRCKFDDKKNKWIPIEEVNEKYPNNIIDINKNFKIEEYDMIDY